MNPSQLAQSFSTGDFERVFPFLSDTVLWTVIGSESFSGKDAVVENCRQVAGYFRSVTTRFAVIRVIEGTDSVVVTGTATFIRPDKRLSFFHACDVYVFSPEGRVEEIRSYCIEDKKEAERMVESER